MTDTALNYTQVIRVRLSPESISLLRLWSVFLLAFLSAFFYCAVIVVFLLFMPLLLTRMPVWMNWSLSVSAVLFGINFIQQGISLYRIEQKGLYYFLVLDAIMAVVSGVAVWVTSFHKASLFFAGIAIAVLIIQYALIQAVYKMTGS
jgi:cytochrome b subunit of formate dehydrogenase